METAEMDYNHTSEPYVNQSGQQHDLEGKQGANAAAAAAQRRATSGGGHSSRRSQPGNPVGADAAVTPACNPAEAAAAATVFSQHAADQARMQLAALVMNRQQQQQQQQQVQQQQVCILPSAPPSTPATATTATAAAAAQSAGMHLQHHPALSQPAAAAADASMSGLEDMEDLFEEAEGVVDTFMRHPSNPNAAKLFGADFTDALARLASHSTPAAAAGTAADPVLLRQKKPSFLSSLGFGGFNLGFNNQQQQQQQQQQGVNSTGKEGPEPPCAAGIAHLTGTKRSKPSFTMSRIRDPAADRPSSRRELKSNGTSDPNSRSAAEAVSGAGDAMAMCVGYPAAPTPPPSATSSAAAEAAGAGFSSRRKWGLDLSDSGMATSRPSPFASAGRPSDSAAAAAAAAGSFNPSNNQPGSLHSIRQHRASCQGIGATKTTGFKSDGAALKTAARRCSCPGAYPPDLNLTGSGPMTSNALQGPAAATGPHGPHDGPHDPHGPHDGPHGTSLARDPSGSIKVLDLSSPRACQGGTVNDVSMSPFASPGTASSSALAAAAAAAVAAAGGAAGAGSGMLAAGAFSGMPAAAAAGGDSGCLAMSTSEYSSSRGPGSSLQSKRSVGGASAVKKTPKPSSAAAAAAAAAGGSKAQAACVDDTAATAAANSPPAVFVTITSASGQGPLHISLTRKVSSRSTGSPQTDDSLAAAAAAAAAGDYDMAVTDEELAAACAAAVAAVAAGGGNADSSSGQEQQQDGVWPRLPPIRTKSRTEGPAAVLNPSAAGTAALEALGYPAGTAVAAAAAAPATTAVAAASGLDEVIAQQKLALLQHHHQQQQQQAMSTDTQSLGEMQSQGFSTHEHPKTPSVTPATAHAAAAAGTAAGGMVHAASTVQLLAAAAASLNPVRMSQQAAESARVSWTGTPSGIVSSIAQMTLHGPRQLPMQACSADQSAGSQGISAGQAVQVAAGPKAIQQQQQQQGNELPWQNLPANACNGVALVNGDSGLVLLTGRVVTTGLFKPAGQPACNAQPQSSMMMFTQGDGQCGFFPAQSPAFKGYNAAAQAAGYAGYAVNAGYVGAAGFASMNGAAGTAASATPAMARPYSTGAQSAAAWGGGCARQGLGPNSAAIAQAPGFSAGVGAMGFGSQAQQAAGRRMSSPQVTYSVAGTGMQGLAGTGMQGAMGASMQSAVGAGIQGGCSAAMQGVAGAANQGRFGQGMTYSPGPFQPTGLTANGAGMWGGVDPTRQTVQLAPAATSAAVAAQAGLAYHSPGAAAYGLLPQSAPGGFPVASGVQLPCVDAIAGSSPGGGVICDLPGFGDVDVMQDELCNQQLQDLLANSALMQRPIGDMFGSFACQ